MKMKRIVMAIAMVSALGLGGCGAIDSGNSGVRIAWDNEVNMNELNAGFFTSVISSVEEFVGKEIMISLDDMTPKAGDNLTMAELDVEVYYTAARNSHADLKVKYANATVYEDGYYYPAYTLVKGQARSAVYKAVGHMDSLTIHKNRIVLQDEIKLVLQDILNVSDPEVFTITKVIVKKANTDPTLERSIQVAIQKDKELEAKLKEEAIKQAEARANNALSASLSPNIMRVKELKAMVDACSKGNTCIIDFTGGKTGVMPLINRPAG